MSESRSFALLSVVVCLMQLYAINASVEVVNKKNSVQIGYLMLDSYSFKDGNIVYGICNGQKQELNCSVIQAKNLLETATSCNITIKAEQMDAEIYSRIGMAALGQDKAIVFWHEEGLENYLKFATIKMNTCEMKEIKVTGVPTVAFIDLFHSRKILTYEDDSYDVMLQDPERCGDKACKMSIDSQGKLTSEPKPYMTTHGQFMAYTSSITTGSPSYGYVYTIIESNKSSLWMIKPNGTEKEIATYENHPVRTVSGIHNLISACFRPKRNSDINCTQYDKEGNITVTAILPDVDEKTDTLIMHNLPKGGFLVMLVEYEKCDGKECTDEKGYSIVKIDESGKKVGTLRLEEFVTVVGRREWAYIYDNGNDKYCAVLVGNELATPHGDSHIVANCFSDDDFKK